MIFPGQSRRRRGSAWSSPSSPLSRSSSTSRYSICSNYSRWWSWSTWRWSFLLGVLVSQLGVAADGRRHGRDKKLQFWIGGPYEFEAESIEDDEEAWLGPNPLDETWVAENPHLPMLRQWGESDKNGPLRYLSANVTCSVPTSTAGLEVPFSPKRERERDFLVLDGCGQFCATHLTQRDQFDSCLASATDDTLFRFSAEITVPATHHCNRDETGGNVLFNFNTNIPFAEFEGKGPPDDPDDKSFPPLEAVFLQVDFDPSVTYMDNDFPLFCWTVPKNVAFNISNLVYDYYERDPDNFDVEDCSLVETKKPLFPHDLRAAGSVPTFDDIDGRFFFNVTLPDRDTPNVYRQSLRFPIAVPDYELLTENYTVVPRHVHFSWNRQLKAFDTFSCSLPPINNISLVYKIKFESVGLIPNSSSSSSTTPKPTATTTTTPKTTTTEDPTTTTTTETTTEPTIITTTTTEEVTTTTTTEPETTTTATEPTTTTTTEDLTTTTTTEFETTRTTTEPITTTTTEDLTTTTTTEPETTTTTTEPTTTSTTEDLTTTTTTEPETTTTTTEPTTTTTTEDLTTTTTTELETTTTTTEPITTTTEDLTTTTTTEPETTSTTTEPTTISTTEDLTTTTTTEPETTTTTTEPTTTTTTEDLTTTTTTEPETTTTTTEPTTTTTTEDLTITTTTEPETTTTTTPPITTTTTQDLTTTTTIEPEKTTTTTELTTTSATEDPTTDPATTTADMGTTASTISTSSLPGSPATSTSRAASSTETSTASSIGSSTDVSTSASGTAPATDTTAWATTTPGEGGEILCGDILDCHRCVNANAPLSLAVRSPARSRAILNRTDGADPRTPVSKCYWCFLPTYSFGCVANCHRVFRVDDCESSMALQFIDKYQNLRPYARSRHLAASAHYHPHRKIHSSHHDSHHEL